MANSQLYVSGIVLYEFFFSTGVLLKPERMFWGDCAEVIVWDAG